MVHAGLHNSKQFKFCAMSSGLSHAQYCLASAGPYLETAQPVGVSKHMRHTVLMSTSALALDVARL